MRLRSVHALALALATAACDPKAPAASSSATPTPPPASSTTSPPAPPFVPAGAAPSAAELALFAKSSNAFALDLYAKARAQPGNLALAPFSLSTALLMTWAGARGATEAEMRKVLHLTAAGDRALDVAGSLIAGYGAADQKVTVRVANRLFGDKGYAFEAPFLARLTAALGAPLEPIDFKGAAEAGRARINGWVSHETQDRIKELIPPNGVDATTRLVLTNAIYFLGSWETPFESRATTPAPFHVSATAQKQVPTMHATETFGFATAAGAKLLDMPYQGDALAMTLVLPDAVDGLDALEARLTPEVLDGWLRGLARTRVMVSLPKFEIDPAASLSLGELLSGLGMPTAFDREKADFTGIGNPPKREDRLFIAKVFHKAFVKVDEKGTEAAGASAVVMAKGGGPGPAAAAAELNADHPFLYLLRDTRTGLVLFMGRVGDPASPRG